MEVLWAIGLAVLLLASVAQVLALRRRLESGLSSVIARLESVEKASERGERAVREESIWSREESSRQARSLREELAATLKGVSDTLVRATGEMLASGRDQLDRFAAQIARLTESNERKLEEMRSTLEQKLVRLQEDNSRKLDEMRKTVDEKLESTLHKRLGESFGLVSERLEQVHKGLGEMQALASGVGDLKKVLTNVKARGTWGEIQLGNLLEQVLSPEQYSRNVVTKEGSGERVDFVVNLPGRDEMEGQTVWLPIDAKFPKEDFERMVDASERGDAQGVEDAGCRLESQLRSSAREIQEKYLNPPRTTDFGVMFLPSEGLYAEVLRRPGLVEQLQRDCRISIAGPTTLAALLNSLQMGFRTLAIQKRAGEVWTVLGTVKTEFERFGDVIGKVQKKLQEAGNVIDNAAARTRAIQRQLNRVQELPAAGASAPLDAMEREDKGEEPGRRNGTERPQGVDRIP
ncbi:MAG: DNA recombination protein RmuC [Acidobacteriota bacterium]